MSKSWLHDKLTKDPRPRPSRVINNGQRGAHELDLAVVEKTGLSPSDVQAVRRALFLTIAEMIDTGMHVNIRGFATFYIARRAARKFRIPTGDLVHKPETDLPKVKFSEALQGWIAGPGSSYPKNT